MVMDDVATQNLLAIARYYECSHAAGLPGVMPIAMTAIHDDLAANLAHWQGVLARATSYSTAHPLDWDAAKAVAYYQRLVAIWQERVTDGK